MIAVGVALPRRAEIYSRHRYQIVPCGILAGSTGSDVQVGRDERAPLEDGD